MTTPKNEVDYILMFLLLVFIICLLVLVRVVNSTAPSRMPDAAIHAAIRDCLTKQGHPELVRDRGLPIEINCWAMPEETQ